MEVRLSKRLSHFLSTQKPHYPRNPLLSPPFSIYTVIALDRLGDGLAPCIYTNIALERLHPQRFALYLHKDRTSYPV